MNCENTADDMLMIGMELALQGSLVHAVKARDLQSGSLHYPLPEHQDCKAVERTPGVSGLSTEQKLANLKSFWRHSSVSLFHSL